MLPPLLSPIRSDTSETTSKSAPKKSTRLIRDLVDSDALTGILIMSAPKTPPRTMTGTWIKKAFLQPSVSLMTITSRSSV